MYSTIVYSKDQNFAWAAGIVLYRDLSTAWDFLLWVFLNIKAIFLNKRPTMEVDNKVDCFKAWP